MKPCRECPWRRASMPGWVGGNTPEEWAELARSDARIICHLAGESQCVGAAIFRRNIRKMPRDKGALVLERDTVRVFGTAEEFVAHHRSRGPTSAELFRK